MSDNYAWLLVTPSRRTALVDPVEPSKVLAALRAEGLEESSVECILTTHRHSDHSGGNVELAKHFPGITVYGGKGEEIPAVTKEVGDGDEFKVGDATVRVLHTPCHTKGHVLYYVTDAAGSAPLLFSGDTLFAAGCGRFFEGTAAQMYENLCVKVAKLPDNTKVCCGHEYTLSNLAFAASVEPENEDIKKSIAEAKQLRDKGLPTVPTTLAQEKLHNPFMRVGEASVQKAAGKTDGVEVMAAIRSQKDNFKAPV